MNTGADAFLYHAWLASACLPAKALLKMLERYLTPEGCYVAFQTRRVEVRELITESNIHVLTANSEKNTLQQMQQKLVKYGISAMTVNDPDYPKQLTDLQEPPGILFWQGNLNALNGKCLAMVGSRAASYAGQRATRRLAENLSRYGIRIVSGFATGIDASAHRGCLEGNSPTIAVMGCGLDRVYPSDHVLLRDEILKNGGLLLSEYSPGEKPAGWHFPVRNRIITGLSAALVLMEARIRSGSMTSVHHALDQGKDVFVYPGDPNSEQFEGNHQLLREGATYFTRAEDILEDLRWLDNPLNVRQNSDCSTEAKTEGSEQSAVMTALKHGMLSFEQLLNHTGMNASSLMSTLTIMQIKGMIEALPGKQYQVKQ